MKAQGLPSDGTLPASAAKVARVLSQVGLDAEIVQLPVAARTCAQAAAALRVDEAQIAKSLVFRGGRSGCAVLVIAAGDRRVSEAAVGRLLGEPIVKAPPAFVREHAGYAIGGVPPLAHDRPMTSFIDASVRRFEAVWVAGGTPHCVFRIGVSDLLRVSGAREAQVTEAPSS